MGQTIRGTNPTKRLPGFRPFGPPEGSSSLEFPERLALRALQADQDAEEKWLGPELEVGQLPRVGLRASLRGVR